MKLELLPVTYNGIKFYIKKKVQLCWLCKWLLLTVFVQVAQAVTNLYYYLKTEFTDMFANEVELLSLPLEFLLKETHCYL